MDTPVKANPKTPRTDRGRRTLRKLLDAAAAEFGEKGFYEASISSITQRAGMALGSFYTYFDSKEALFSALVSDMSANVMRAARGAIAPDMSALDVEQAALGAFLRFAAEHREIYRIIDEAEFVDPVAYRKHYETTAQRIAGRLESGSESGDLRPGLGELHAWAIMGMNVFIGLRYVVWGDGTVDPGTIAREVNNLIAHGIAAGEREAEQG